MDTALIIFCLIGVLMFIAYMFFIVKTSYDDQKKKKQEKLHPNGTQ